MNETWRGLRVVVTGGAGFIGSAVCRLLRARGAGEIHAPRSAEYDLTRREDAARMLDHLRPDVVILAAGVGGGIAAHKRHPGSHFTANTLMAIHTIDEARTRSVAKLVYLGSADSYSPSVSLPAREDDLWAGALEASSAGYGLAKKLPIAMLDAYRSEYGQRAAAVILTNVYGPGASFDPETSHVVPALIRRFDEAVRSGAHHVVCWGSGKPTRDLLYVEDAAEGVLLAAERLDDAQPVNLASGEEVSIADLAGVVATLCGFEGTIAWDTSRPDGHPRRVLDVSRARTLLGFRTRAPLLEGLRRSIEWWRTRAAAQ